MSNLPAEVLYEIFSILKQSQFGNSLCECAVVCKKWNQTCRYMLYSKVEIKDQIKLQKFVKSIKHNERLAELVKELLLDYDKYSPYQNTTFTDLFNHLSNLETFSSTQNISYLPILNALSDSKLLCFKKLEVLPLEEPDFDNYAACALLMKNRLENLIITDRTTNSPWSEREWNNTNKNRELEAYYFNKKKANFDRLYSELHLFPKLKELHLTVEVEDPIRVLQSVTQKCPELHTLSFSIGLEDVSHKNKYDYITVAPECTPKVNIKAVYGYEVDYHQSTFLPYFMDTYPQLQSLILGPTKSSAKFVQKETAKRFFGYLSRIDRVDVRKFCLQLDDIFDVTRSFFEDPTLLTSKHLIIIYSSGSRGVAKLDIVKRLPNANRIHTLVEYPVPRGNVLEHAKLIEEFGRQFRSVVIDKDPIYYSIDLPDFAKHMIYGNSIDHVLCHCPNLEKLYIKRCNLEKIDFSYFCLSNQKVDFPEFGIVDCVVDENIFKELSTAFKSIRQLDLSNNRYCCNDGHLFKRSANIDMVNTDIDKLIFTFAKDRSNRELFIKIYTAASKEDRFYKCDFQAKKSGVIKPSEEGEYQERTDFLVNIRCQSLKSLEVYINNRRPAYYFAR